jgi:hypothetical protein
VDAPLPVSEAVLIAHLKANAVTLGVPAANIAQKLGTGRPAVRVTRVGGQPERGEDHSFVSSECWAASDYAAAQIAYQIVAVMPDIIGAQVRGWAPATGPLSRPDTDGSPRYIVDVELLVYA